MKKALSFFLTLLLAAGSISAMENQATLSIENLPPELSCQVASEAGILSPEAKNYFSGLTYSNVEGIEFSPDGKKLFIRFEDKTAQLIDLITNQVINNYKNVLSIIFSSDNTKFIINFRDKTAQLVNLTTNQPIIIYQNYIETLEILAAFSRKAIDDDKATFDTSLNLEASFKKMRLIISHIFLHTSNIRFSPDNKKAFIRFNDYTAQLIDLTTNNQTIATFQNVDGIAFSPDNKKVFIGFKDYTAQLIDLNLLNYLNNYLTVEQARFLQQLYTDLSNGKIPNRDVHGKEVWQSLPQELQQIIQRKINEIIRKRNQNNNNNA